MIAAGLLFAGVLLGLVAVWVCGTFAMVLVRGIAWHRRDRLYQLLLPGIQEALVDYLAGSDDQTRLREFVKISREAVGAALMSFEGTVAGGARDRLCELSLELALLHDWCGEARSKDPAVRRTAISRLAFVCSFEPCRRVAGDLLMRALDDPDEEVKLPASRALIQSGSLDDVEQVFVHTIGENLLVRILLTEELRRHAMPLCQRAIPKVLAEHSTERTLAMLQMVAAWERALPIPAMGELLYSHDSRLRLIALRLASLAPDSPELRKGVLDALADENVEIARAAVDAAGRLRIEAAVPGLARCLRLGEPILAHAAAEALAAMPPRGLITLRELSTSANPVTALAAIEALARVGGDA